MKLQNEVILSIGSNQGDRLENIIQCINLIHQEIGDVTKVSRLYETPSWGFESDAFYNAAVAIRTNKSPDEVLVGILAIEKKLGRIRNIPIGYQARTIDIDIIFFNDQIIETEDLQVPHPQMQHRLFVLLPIKDLQMDLVHPILVKTISDLIEECEDKSECTIVSDLEVPKRN